MGWVSIDQSIYPEHQSMIVHVLLIVVSIDQSIYPEHQPMIVLLIVVSIDQSIYPEHQSMIVHVLLIVVSIGSILTTIKSTCTIMDWCSG
jgi:hypothetical protein